MQNVKSCLTKSEVKIDTSVLYVETKNPSGKPANCQPAGLPRGEMIPYIQANPPNFQINRAIGRNSPKTCITRAELHLKTFIEKNNYFLKKEKKKEK